MQKALANGHLPGVLPGAESPANLLIANEPARALAPGKMCQSQCRLFSRMQAFAGVDISHFQTIC
jgi:hypothetical protein